MPLPATTLLALFDDALARFADRPCLDFLGRRWRYVEVGALVAAAAGGLHRLGIGQGSRVGLCLPNGPHYVLAFFAILRTGATVVNCNPLYTSEELARIVRDAEVDLMLAPDLLPIQDRVLDLLDKTPLRHVVVCSFAGSLPWLKGLAFRVLQRASIGHGGRGDQRVSTWEHLSAGPPVKLPAPRPGDVAVLQFTGGTTGLPKAAMLTHANLAANCRQVIAWSPTLTPGAERMLAVLPFFHVFALTAILLAAFAEGAELILLPRFEAGPLLATLRRTRPSIFHVVPTLLKALIDAGVTRDDLTSIKVCISGGAPLPEEIRRSFEALGACRVLEGYGLTEASPVCLCNPLVGDIRPGSIGLPLPGVRVEIRALDNPLNRLPPGERGEVCVAGPNIMAGYWHRPEETAEVLLPDGFLRTGDVGIMDASGFVTLVDRIKDLIICSGYKVFPRMIEEALYRNPDVAAATVVGMPDAYRGESPAAFVELRPGGTATVEDLREMLGRSLSPITMPRVIEIRARLPRTAVGKLSKTELRAELRARQSESDHRGVAP
jgi:long-chain acyl-CoA synthetase